MSDIEPEGDALKRAKAFAVSLPPTTTAQQDLVVAGQRRVNIIWEVTQAVIAVLMVGATVTASLYLTFHPRSGEGIPNILSALCGMVVGAYFQRTNHMNIGGIGPKPQQPYEGR